MENLPDLYNNISNSTNLDPNTLHKENGASLIDVQYSEAFVSNEVRDWFMYVFDPAVTGAVAYVGIVVNVITIIIFYKQGYKETINISLTTIAIWDLLKCFIGAVQRFHGPLKLVSEAFNITFYSCLVLVGYAATFSTYVSAVLAGYVAIERCLCVSLPFTVKFLLTPKVVTSVNVLLSVISFGSFAMIFSMHKIVWLHHPGFNTTVALYTFSDIYYKYKDLYQNYFNVVGFLWPIVSLIVMCSCTVIISGHLRKASKFRSGNLGSASKGEQYKELSSRDRRVIKILLVIIVIYIVNMSPRLAVSVAKNILPGFYLQLYHHNLFIACLAFEYLFDFINAAINPFVYFFMSSQYRDSVKELLHCWRKKI